MQPPKTTRMEIDSNNFDVSELLQRNSELESQLDSHQLSLARLQLRYEELRTKEAAWAAQQNKQSADLERANSKINRLTGGTNSVGLNASSSLQTALQPHTPMPQTSNDEELNKTPNGIEQGSKALDSENGRFQLCVCTKSGEFRRA